MQNLSPSEESSLLDAARAATDAAYAPYSRFRVGAAVLLADGRTFSGCNVENASYGLSNCAERTAIFCAVSASRGTKPRIRAIAVVNADDAHCAPCGACRQVIAEFSAPDTLVLYIGADGTMRTTVGELLPDSFRL